MKLLWLLPVVILLVAWLWITTRSIHRLRGQIDEAEARLARRFYTLQGRVTEMDARVRELDFERRRSRGEIRFASEMTVAEATAVHPRVREVFAALGLGGSSCGTGGLDESRTILEVCRDASVDPGSILEALDRFVEDPDGPIQLQPATAKLYQIRPVGPS